MRRKRLIVAATLAATTWFAAAPRLRAAVPTLRGIAIDEPLDGPALVAEAIAAGADVSKLPIMARIAVDLTAFSGPSATDAFARLDARLALYRGTPVKVVLAFGAFPADPSSDAAWIDAATAVVQRGRGVVGAYQIGEVTGTALPAAERDAFSLRRAATQVVHANDSAALAIQGPIPVTLLEWERQTYLKSALAPHLDGVAIAGPNGLGDDAYRSAAAAMADVVDVADPGASVIAGPFVPSEDPRTASGQMVDVWLRTTASTVGVTTFRVTSVVLRPALTAFGRLSDFFAADMAPSDDEAVSLKLFAGTTDVTSTIKHRVLFSPGTANTFIVYWGAAASMVDLVVTTQNMSGPMVRDPIAGTMQAPTERAGSGGARRFSVPLADHALVLDFNFETKSRAQPADIPVTGTGAPDVLEIVAHAQQKQAAQDAVVKNFIAKLRIDLRIRATFADPPYDFVLENVAFSDRTGIEWQQVSMIAGGRKFTKNFPGLPLIQPETVMSRPLDLRMNDDYRYTYGGLDKVGEREAYVVHFEPVRKDTALFRGTVWVDKQTSARLKLSVVQTHNSGAVVSNEEDHFFSHVGDVAGQAIWLTSRRVSRQVILIGGNNLPFEQTSTFSDVQLNAGDFEARRAAVRESDAVMLRDTDHGVRYFVKKSGERVVSDSLTASAKAFAMGADIDPSFDFPLPIAGLNVVDFDFLGKDMQLAMLFGGVIALGNIQKAHMIGQRIDGSVDFFGLALKSTDSIFDAGGERIGERVQSIPAEVGASIGYQLTGFQKITARYGFKYDARFSAPDSDPAFTRPASTATTTFGLRYEFRRKGYSLNANVGVARRMTWTPWGLDGTFDPATRGYSKYDVSVQKDFIFNAVHSVHISGQYFGGQRLDRFSMYQFGIFDATRMHGVPSAIRFPALAMLRASYSLNLFDLYRLDLFLDHARGQDRGAGNAWRPVTGIGVGLNLRGPFGTLLRSDVGKSFLPANYRGAGSVVIQFMILKPL